MMSSVSPEETFLAAFPCFNNFSAQMILYASDLSLKDLLSAQPEELKRQVPWLPDATRVSILAHG